MRASFHTCTPEIRTAPRRSAARVRRLRLTRAGSACSPGRRAAVLERARPARRNGPPSLAFRRRQAADIVRPDGGVDRRQAELAGPIPRRGKQGRAERRAASVDAGEVPMSPTSSGSASYRPRVWSPRSGLVPCRPRRSSKARPGHPEGLREPLRREGFLQGRRAAYAIMRSAARPSRRRRRALRRDLDHDGPTAIT